MKYLLFIAVVISANVVATDISFRQIEISREDAWKYGIKLAEKKIEDDIHLSIEVNESLLCQPKSVTAVSYTSTNIGRELETGYFEGHYYTSTNTIESEKVEFWIRCKNISKVHKVFHVVFIAWEKNA